MRRVKWGVLGTADIAKGQTIPGMLLAEHCELYAIAGRKIEKAKDYQETFGFQKAYGNYDELLEDPEVEAVYIPLPNDLHCKWTIRALKAGKHVLCEKPLAITEEQVREMFRTAEDNHVFLMEAFAYLHSPYVQAIKKEVDSGVIGEIRYLESSFITGRRPDTDIRLRRETFGGAMYDLGCYTSSLVLWLLGKEPDTIRAIAQFSDKKIDLFTAALLEYEGGSVVKLACGMVLTDGRMDRLYIGGTKGEIESTTEFNQCGETYYTVRLNGKEQTKTVTAPNNYTLEAEQLSRCILTGEKPHISKSFSLMVARVTDRILKGIGY